MAEYSYDAWGYPESELYYYSSANPGVEFSPFRYRGYWYDAETKLYYLNSRYYNPEWGRFINADIYLNANGDIIGFNMFAYCGNNPVNYLDTSGESGLALVVLLVKDLFLTYTNKRIVDENKQIVFVVITDKDDSIIPAKNYILLSRDLDKAQEEYKKLSLSLKSINPGIVIDGWGLLSNV